MNGGITYFSNRNLYKPLSLFRIGDSMTERIRKKDAEDLRLIVAESDSYTFGMVDRKYVLAFSHEVEEKVKELEREGWFVVDILLPSIEFHRGNIKEIFFEEPEARNREY